MPADAPPYLDCVLITGASAGLGCEFALQLAPFSNHLVLVARREQRLKEIKDALLSVHPDLRVTTVSCDLSLEEKREKLLNYLETSEISPTLLINNAGLGDYGEFSASEWGKIRSMMEVNMSALTHLTYGLLPAMREKGYGAIMNVSSVASLVPIPDFTVYAATKAYVTSFGEGLRAELAEENISVLTVCPGPVKTEFGKVAARENEEFHAKGYEALYVEAKTVVTDSLNALFRNAPRVYPGRKVAFFANAIDALPSIAVRAFNSFRPRQSITREDQHES